jgi:hypothetical protein
MEQRGSRQHAGSGQQQPTGQAHQNQSSRSRSPRASSRGPAQPVNRFSFILLDSTAHRVLQAVSESISILHHSLHSIPFIHSFIGWNYHSKPTPNKPLYLELTTTNPCASYASPLDEKKKIELEHEQPSVRPW